MKIGKGNDMTGISAGTLIVLGIIISSGCFFLWSWANDNLFTYLGDVEINGHMEACYTYDTMTLPARIVCFLCGVAAITIFWLTWFGIYGIICS